MEAAASLSLAIAGASRRAQGRRDDSPIRLSARAWRQIAVRVWQAFNRDNISIIAAGVSFNIILAIFPALAAFVSLYGLVADVNTAAQHVTALRMLLPADFGKIVGEEMLRLARGRPGGLSLTLAVGILVSLWSANGAMRAMILGLNVAYDTKEKRGFIQLTLVTLALTLGLMTFLTAVLLAMGSGAVATAVLGPRVGWAIDLLRWPVLLLASVGGLCILYRLGPCRPFARWRWITWGSAVATLVWLAASAAFSIYVSRFANLGRTYGSLATAVSLMLWIWLTAAIVLAGAELNAEIERASTGG
jgi:membrane protein